jgi:hypothetical protein
VKPELRAVRVRIVGRHLPGRTCGAYTGVRVGLQVGREVHFLVDADVDEACWEAPIQLGVEDGHVVARGKALYGPRRERFIYLSWHGRLGGEPEMMFRRAKLQLDGVPLDVLTEAMATGTLVGRLSLTDGCGMPRCASVRPPLIVWSVS